MTNFEKYKDDIKKVDYHFGVDLNYNIFKCGCKPCRNCIFYDAGCCIEMEIKWLYEEYKEHVNLTDFDKEFLKRLLSVGYDWIARDANKKLYFYERKPEKVKKTLRWESNNNGGIEVLPDCFDNFPFIKWENEEPYNIKELLEDK